MEKSGSLQTRKIYIGETVTFQLKNDDTGWYERTIFDILPDDGLINFEGVKIHVDSISQIRFTKKPFFPMLIGNAMQGGGANMILFDISRALSWGKEQGIDETMIYSGLANIAVGTAIKKLTKEKKFKVSKRKRLRLLNLDFSSPIPIT